MGKTSTISDAVTYGLNDEYWERLTPEQQAMYRHVRPHHQRDLHGVAADLAYCKHAGNPGGGRAQDGW